MRALAVVMLLCTTARADRDLCARGTRFRGQAVDLDVKNAEVHDLFRLLSDVGKVNIVVPDDVTGKVTLKLQRVPWDQVACVIAAVKKLTITVQGNVLLVLPRAAQGAG